ncbi:MAG: hypothetical protein LDLANPLL_01866 [Turneriella sp.]|nr:hypothetical protein [Turneriella sp.]
MYARHFVFIATALLFFTSSCRNSVTDVDISHDIKYLAAFSSPTIASLADEQKFSEKFQSNYKSRIVLLRPVTGQANLTLASTKISLFAFIKINALREARLVTQEIASALPGASLVALYPVAEIQNSQDNFSGNVFYISLEKRNSTFLRLSGLSKQENLRSETDAFTKDRNLLSYYAATMLNDTPYHTIHILGYSGIAETQYQTLDGLHSRTLKRLDAVDTVLVEKIR